jgi:hypothetical protein
MPLGLHELIERLPPIVRRLDALDGPAFIRQVPHFRDRFYPHFGHGT